MRLKAKQDRCSITVAVCDLIDPDNEVRLIDTFVEKLDIVSHGFNYKTAKEGIDLGGPSEYDPKDLLRIYIYGYLNRVRSSRLLEKVCKKNIEVIWLLGNLSPSHNTINEFRRCHPLALFLVFQTFNTFWQELGLFIEDSPLEDSPLEDPDSITYATDGSRFAAQNSKTNNYNLEKIEANLSRYDKKAIAYLKELSELEDGLASPSLELKPDGDGLNDLEKTTTELASNESEELEQLVKEVESNESNQPEEVETAKAVILEKLKHIHKGKQRNLMLKEALVKGGETQISLTDADARRLTKNKTSIVGYNVQISTEATHKLIAHFQVVNKGDIHLFAQMGEPTAEFLTAQDKSIKVNGLGDKGYDNGEDIYKCEQMGITTYISPSRNFNTQKPIGFRKENFQYDLETDTYLCPQNQVLTRTGNLYKKRAGRVKDYRAKTADCLACPFKEKCLSKSSLEKPLGRVIRRTEFEDAKDANRERVSNNKELYGKRKAIVEHPFGTIKRQWGYDYTLLKGFAKVTGEFALIFSVYNLRRAITELGVNAIIDKLNEQESLVFSNFSPKLLIGVILRPLIGFFEWLTTGLVKAHGYLLLE